MEAVATVVIGFIVFIALTTAGCEALFFTSARKLHTQAARERVVGEDRSAFAKSSRDSPESFRGWRRGELNPCPRRYPRKHLHVYPVRFLRSRRCTGTLPTPERPRISFTVRRGHSAVRLACCPRLAP